MHRHINEYVQYLMMACVVCGSATLNTETEREIVVMTYSVRVCVCRLSKNKIQHLLKSWNELLLSHSNSQTHRGALDFPSSLLFSCINPAPCEWRTAVSTNQTHHPLGGTSDIRRAPVATQAWSPVWPTCINTPDICLVVLILFLSVCVLSVRF